MTSRPVLILGSYDFAEEVADIVNDVDGLEVAAFAENTDRSRCDRPLLGKPVIWIDDLAPYSADHLAVCSIGTTRRKAFCEAVEAMGFEFATPIHPTANILPSARIAPGTVVSMGVNIAAHATLGKHIIVNRGSLIGHHTTISDYCTISPGANIGGRVLIGPQTYIGMGSIIINDKQVGAHSLVGAGALVTKNFGDHVKLMGLPARIVEEDFPGF